MIGRFLCWIIKLFNSIDWDVNCPHCGQYCTGKTIFCTPPIGNRHEKGKDEK